MIIQNRKTKAHALVVILAVLAFTAAMIAGCVPAKVNPEAAPVVTVQDAFAAEVAAMTCWTTAVMVSPLGAASQVRAGDFYTSGLGQTCRHATVTVNGESHRVVICKDGEQWYTAAPIFEGQPR
ncbi:MAG: hypothetical protein IKJ34_01290 [Mailhella sp.]|nr:hypothetical protein [Mailhella sp.]